MNRREFLRASAATAGGVAFAGCLEALGFETQSAWRNPPLVEDRPDAVYIPSSIEGMGTYGTTTDAGYAFLLTYTYPHRFWTVTGRRTNRVVVDDDDSLHLMATPFDPETGLVLPLDTSLEIARNGESVTELSLWPMLSQRMGFHYGDNVSLPEEGTYTATIRAGPIDANRFGTFGERFGAPAAATIEFEYDTDDVYDLGFETVEEERRGDRGAIPLMDHAGGGHDSANGTDGEHDGESTDTHTDSRNGTHGTHTGGGAHDEHDGHGGRDETGMAMPTSVSPAIDELPGALLGTDRSGDAEFVATALEGDVVSRFGDGERTYLAVSPRSPYNRVVLPFMSLSARIVRGTEPVFDESLAAGIDDRLGYHYGAPIGRLRTGDTLRVSIDAPPQAARHDGYETAFLEMPPVELTV